MIESVMIQKKELLEEIKSAVSQLKPFKAIVFGSFAYGIPHKDSDLDIDEWKICKKLR